MLYDLSSEVLITVNIDYYFLKSYFTCLVLQENDEIPVAGYSFGRTHTDDKDESMFF